MLSGGHFQHHVLLPRNIYMLGVFSDRRGRAGVFACAVMLLTACGQADKLLPTAPMSPRSPSLYSLYDPEAGFISVGVFGGPAGTYAFHTDVLGGGLFSGGINLSDTFDTPRTPANAGFHYAYFPVDASTWGPGVTAQVTINEVGMPSNRVVDSIRVVTNGVWMPVITGASAVTITTSYTDISFVKFYHSEAVTPPPGAGKGCTPGYWKQSQHFGSWVPTGLAPTNLVGSVFSSASLYSLSGISLSNYKLVDGLAFKGGPGLVGAAQILLRAAIAADLNARYAGMGYPLAAASVVTAVNNALSSANRDTMLSLATQLDDMNNLGCQLN